MNHPDTTQPPTPAVAPAATDVLDTILNGARTQAQVAEPFGIDLDPVRDYGQQSEMIRTAPAQHLWQVLNHLVCDGMLNMQVVDAEWHYLPTGKAKASRKAKLATGATTAV